MSEGWRLRQFRMKQIQMYNWGTFCGLHVIPISPEGHLLIGRSGSGKSSLLDSISALLIPRRWQEFNAAARKGDRGKNERNFVSYVRGAWGEQTNESGQIVTQYLRTGTTWSAIAIEYGNEAGQTLTLIQLLALRGESNQDGDVKHYFMTANRRFNIETEIAASFSQQMDYRKLKQKLVDVKTFDTFDAYSEYFRRVFNIDNETALKLLQKAAAMKDMGSKDLNGFLRDFMLDIPETFIVAKRLVDGFTELESAHSEVIAARMQIEVLTPARKDYLDYRVTDQQLRQLAALEKGVDAYRFHKEKRLIELELKKLATEDQGLEGLENQQLQVSQGIAVQIKALKEEHAQKGGAKIQELEQSIKEAGKQRDARQEKKALAEGACTTLGRPLSKSPQDFAILIADAQGMLDRRMEEFERNTDAMIALSHELDAAKKDFFANKEEIESMKKKPSNIDSRMHAMRLQIANAVGIPEEDLPFVGELIEVRKEDSEWQGAINRLLRGFALSLLVEDKHYSAVSAYIDKTVFAGNRIVYYRVVQPNYTVSQSSDARSVINKINIQECLYKPWLSAQLAKRFDYICAADLKEFRDVESAITQQGQIKHGREKHEKDDRRALNDPRDWVIGFDNTAKRLSFEEVAKKLASRISDLSAKISKYKDSNRQQSNLNMACQTLVNLKWQEIDILSSMNHIRELSTTCDELRKTASKSLKELEDRISSLEKSKEDADKELEKTRVNRKVIEQDKDKLTKRQFTVEVKVKESPLSDDIRKELEPRYESFGDPAISTIGEIQGKVRVGLKNEQSALMEEQADKKQAIERSFRDFLMQWPVLKSDLQDKMEYAPEFMRHLEKLERDDLPRVEDRFFAMLQDQGTQNLTALNSYISEARKKIRARMDEVNAVLEETDFNPGTFLYIQTNDRHLSQVEEFRGKILQVISNSWISAKERNAAEERFKVLRDLVTRLKSEDKADIVWKELVLDVRQHVEFVAKELEKGTRTEFQAHRGTGSRSGGQKERLTGTICAAALRYQLGGEGNEPPLYGPVVIDEALSNSDADFSETVIKIFISMGFQLILATPMKSIQVIEPYVGGASYVAIQDYKYSNAYNITYDEQNRRLNLSEEAAAVNEE